MKLVIGLTILGAAVGGFVDRLTRPTNSIAAMERGMEAWENGDAAAAARHFEVSESISPSPEAAFGLGTALAESGSPEEAAEFLGRASSSPKFAAPGFYNLGTIQLNEGRFEEAIEALKQSLRYDPTSIRAKRNLEIALQKQKEEQQQQQQQQQQQSGDEGEDENQPPPETEGEEPGEQEQPAPGDLEGGDLPPELESLLSSVEEQEQEELSRMRKARARSRGLDW